MTYKENLKHMSLEYLKSNQRVNWAFLGSLWCISILSSSCVPKFNENCWCLIPFVGQNITCIFVLFKLQTDIKDIDEELHMRIVKDVIES